MKQATATPGTAGQFSVIGATARVFATGLLAITFAAAGCGQSEPAPAPPKPPVTAAPAPPPPASEPAAASQPASQPSPAAANLPQVDLAGLKQLVAQAGKDHRVLVMDFWATWCGPCVEMFPDLHQKIEALGDHARIVSITLDSPGETEEHAIAYLKDQHALDGAYMLAPGADNRIAAVDGIQGPDKKWNDLVVPAILVFDTNGRMAAAFVENVEVGPVVDRVRGLLANTRVSQP